MTKPPKSEVVVMLRGGRYELAEPLVFAPEDSGTAASPTRFEAYPGETPVLSGGRRVKLEVKNGLWQIPVEKNAKLVRFISVGGEMRRPTRSPGNRTPQAPSLGRKAEPYFAMSGLAGADPKARYDTPADRFEYAEGQFPDEAAKAGDIEVVVLHFWVAGHYGVKNIDPAKRVVVLDRKSRRRFTEDGGGTKPGRFYLLNVPGEIRPGEYHHDRAAGVIRYRPKLGEDSKTTPVVLPRLDAVVRFDGDPKEKKLIEHVQLRGLTFSDTTWREPPTEAIDLQAASSLPGSVQVRGARACEIEGCRLVNLAGYGIEIGPGCRDVLIGSNELTHLGAGGIKINGGDAKSRQESRTSGCEIADNHIHDVGEVYHAGVGILSMHASDMGIVHNHVHHLYYTGISVGWVWGYAESVSRGNLIEGNLIHDVGRGLLSDMGGIYMLGVSPGTVVRGNVLHDTESFGYGGWGIYTDEGSTGITIEKNLVYRTKSGGFHQHYGKNNVVRNNVFAFAREGQIMRSRAEPHRSFTFEHHIVYFKDAPLFAKNWKDDKFAVDWNLYWEPSGKPIPFPGGTLADWQTRGFDRHSIIADPMFVEPDKGDFRLKDGSPAGKIGFVPIDYSKAGVRKTNMGRSPARSPNSRRAKVCGVRFGSLHPG
jgi:hypothetical protein